MKIFQTNAQRFKLGINFNKKIKALFYKQYTLGKHTTLLLCLVINRLICGLNLVQKSTCCMYLKLYLAMKKKFLIKHNCVCGIISK